MPSVLLEIRARTLALHSQLEATLDLEQALSSREAYTDFLEKYLGVYRLLERLMATKSPAIQKLIEWDGRRRVPQLEFDLRTLGVEEERLAATPECRMVPDLGDLDSIFGTFYVIEGSSLGGQLIYREVERLLHLNKDSGAAFFYGEGPDTGTAWKHFIALLEEHVTDPERAAAGACQMFAVFAHSITSQMPVKTRH